MTSKGTRNTIAAKLHDEKGASITFALLLFLVCAVLSSIILVAATTASGRIAGIAESDQRYYSVTSASELMKDLLDGTSASVVEVTTYSTDENGNESATTETYIFRMPAYEVDDSVLNGAAPLSDSPSFDNLDEAAAYVFHSTSNWGSENAGSLGTYTLSGSTDNLKVSINEAKIDQDGNILLKVQSEPDKKGNRFKQSLRFGGTVTKDDHTSVLDQGDGRTIKAETYKWTLTSVTTI